MDVNDEIKMPQTSIYRGAQNIFTSFVHRVWRRIELFQGQKEDPPWLHAELVSPESGSTCMFPFFTKEIETKFHRPVSKVTLDRRMKSSPKKLKPFPVDVAGAANRKPRVDTNGVKIRSRMPIDGGTGSRAT